MFCTSNPLLVFTFVFSAALGAIGCRDKPDASQERTVAAPTKVINKDSTLKALNSAVLQHLKNKDYTQLRTLIHPKEGVLVSPYGFVDTSDYVAIFADDIVAKSQKSDSLYWGAYDGSGDSISLSFANYFAKFVYNADFLNAEKMSVNKMIGSGNSLNNLQTVYPGCDFTENYFSGFDKKYEGMDWCTLRLVFKMYNDRYYLVALVHDQWTI